MGNETESIKKTAMDYIEGWYSASPERMERALHPELAKRTVQNIEGKDQLRPVTFERMIELVKGKKEDLESLGKIECEILDVHGDMASVKTVCPDFIDYVQMAKWEGQWKIINVLWEFTPEAIKRMQEAQKQK